MCARAGSLELLSSKTLWSKDESEFQNSSVIKAVVMITENTNISELSRSGLNGSYLKDNVYVPRNVHCVVRFSRGTDPDCTALDCTGPDRTTAHTEFILRAHPSNLVQVS